MKVQWMIKMVGKIESWRSVLVAQHDEDEYYS